MQGDISTEARQGWIRHCKRFLPKCTARHDRTYDILVYPWKSCKLASFVYVQGTFFLKVCKSLCKDGENINVMEANCYISDAFLVRCAVYNGFVLSRKGKDLTL